MTKFRSRIRWVAALGLPFAFGCSSGAPPVTDTPDLAVVADLARAGDLSMPPAQSELAGVISQDLTLSGVVSVSADVTVAPGVTLTLQPGALLLIADGVGITVKGSLTGTGQSGKPILLRSRTAAGPGAWKGLSLLNGGAINLTYVEIHEADTALVTAAGTSFALDRLVIDSSNAALLLQSSGTVSHAVIHGLGTAQSTGPVTIQDASPRFTDVLIDNANGGVDMVQLNGATSGPVFDHVEITQCHCAFHFNAGSKATISNSNIHDNAYGLMVVYSKSTQVSASNFAGNLVNIGSCAGTGSVTATGVYFDKAGAFDGTCATQTNTAPAGAPLSGVGPRP